MCEVLVFLHVWYPVSIIIIIENILTIKILFTINSPVKKWFSSKHCLQFLSLKKHHLVLIRKKFISLNKNYSNWERLIPIKTIHFN